MNNFYWILTLVSVLFAFYFCYLFIMNQRRKNLLKINSNVKKITLSPGGIPMVWISNNDFFVEIEIDRTRFLSEFQIPEKENFLKDLRKLEFYKPIIDFNPEKKETVRVYFTSSYGLMSEESTKLMLSLNNGFYSDPFILFCLLEKDPTFFESYSCFSIWKRGEIICMVRLKGKEITTGYHVSRTPIRYSNDLTSTLFLKGIQV